MSLDFDECFIAKEVGTEMKKYAVFPQVFKRKCTYLLSIFHDSYFWRWETKDTEVILIFHTWHFGGFIFLELPTTVFVVFVAFWSDNVLAVNPSHFYLKLMKRSWPCQVWTPSYILAGCSMMPFFLKTKVRFCQSRLTVVTSQIILLPGLMYMQIRFWLSI